MIQISLVMMIQIEWWSKSSDDDPDRVMIQIQWCWSKSRDDLDPVMMSHDDPDREMIQIRWLEDEDDLKTQKTWDAGDKMIQLMQRRRPVLKIVLNEYLPS